MGESNDRFMGHRVTVATVVLAAIASVGCGDTNLAAAPTGAPNQDVLLPWTTGNTWTYRIDDEGIVGTKETVVGEMEVVGGTGPSKDVLALRTVTQKLWQNETTVSWQIARGDTVIRFREQSFRASIGTLEREDHWDPHKLHVDGSAARRVAGATWTEAYVETTLPVGSLPSTQETMDQWTVVSASERVDVPAGTFMAVHLTKVSQNGDVGKDYWYVPGVGKVKEVGGQLEELVSYSVSRDRQ